ncbi:MAG: class I SAM-dependent methyltransferase [Phycisphaerales bacterium]
MAADQPSSLHAASTSKVDVPFQQTPGLQPAGPDSGAAVDRFDDPYLNANGEASRVPWADCRPCPLLVEWLNTEAPVLVRPGSRAAVVGCGLGDDVVELADRGYDVLGFDISPAAVKWAARRHPDHADRFMVADLLSLPARLQRRFDLVVEAYTIQSLEVALRERAASAVAGLVAPRGVVLTVCRGRGPDQPLSECLGPPFPLTRDEMISIMEHAGLAPIHGPDRIDELWDSETPPKRRMRGVFIRV